MEMRPEPNNDIDLLLRQLSGRNGIPASENDEQHLDADELNSYVANALPAAARARYTDHLADCSSCRKLVVQLSATQGPLPAQQPASVVAPSGFKSFLASLFSPMVLRYAVPALGLIVIAAVGIFVLRRENRNTNVAQLRDGETRAAPEIAVPNQQPTAMPFTANDSPSVTSPGREAAQNGPVAAPVTKETPQKLAAEPSDQSANAAVSSAAPAPAAPKVAVVQNEPPPAKSPESQAEKKEKADKQEAVNVTASSETIKRDYDKSEGVAVTVAPGATARQDVQVRSAERAAKPMAGAGVAGSLKRAPAESRSREESKDDKRAAETRSVAGRRFRKSAGVWIDTDYDSSKAITGVARGSEQYRALIADEPSIKTIADELDGQIVVVWKGRTYRIR
jgi:hypothetical protein